jgi:hypothetical protein
MQKKIVRLDRKKILLFAINFNHKQVGANIFTLVAVAQNIETKKPVANWMSMFRKKNKMMKKKIWEEVRVRERNCRRS